MKKIIAVLVVVMLASMFAAAQESRGSVFGGYQYMSVGTQNMTRQGTSGFDADLAINVHKNVALVGDISMGWKGDFFQTDVTAHVNNYLFGPRVFVNTGKFTPFMEVEGGLARVGLTFHGSSVTNSSFGLNVGGGLDLNASKNVSIRLFKFGYMLDRVALNEIGITNNLNNIRVASGLVIKF